MLLAAASTHPFSDWKTAGDLSRRALSPGGRGHAAPRPRQPGIRTARSRRHRRPQHRDSHHEFDAVLPAAHPGAVDQFALLDGHEHRLQVVSLQGFRALSPNRQFPTSSPTGRSTRPLSTCWSRPTASTTARRSGGTSGRIRSSIPWKCACATFRCGWTRPLRSPR